MSILQALTSHYDRLVRNGEAPDYGYSRERISYAIVLSSYGEAVDVVDLREMSGRTPRPSLRSVPRPVSRTSAVASNFLWDKTAYMFGVKLDRDTKQRVPAEREHAAFKALHEDLLAGALDKGLKALRTFLLEWQVEHYDSLHHADEMLNANIVFQLDGERQFLHQRPAARSVWRDYLTRQDRKAGLCLVSGEQAPIERLHPKLKGVRGAQSAGASIVSFNLDAFKSFGKDQGDNAPVSERAAFAYTTTLNKLLASDSGRRIQIGDSTTVFWAEAAEAEEIISVFLQPPPDDDTESVLIRDVLAKMARGVPLEEAAPNVDAGTQYCVLGLAPNAARISVRFWQQGSLGELATRFQQHWSDLRLDPTPWLSPPAVWRLLYETAAQRKVDNIPPTLGGALMRSILNGLRYPRSLLAALVTRMRADKEITGMRAAICKACLARDYRLGFEKEDSPVSLNPDEINPAYRLGRLFSVYESVQRAALGNVNATIKDRYYGAASATPASVFPLLERNSANHLASLRKGDKGGLAHWFDQEIDSILNGLDAAFPRSFRIEDQGRFAIGYHHQRATKRAASDGTRESADGEIIEKE